MMRILSSSALSLALLPTLLQAQTQTQGQAQADPGSGAPRLVLQITVDQLRGDLPLRVLDRFGPGGFRLLIENGAYFDGAHYSQGATMTAPGHATLFTGAGPREHGIVGNDWFDPETGRVVYNCQDLDHAVLGSEPKRGVGSSPKNLLSSTIGDELVLATGGRSRSFAVSIKDRGAILPAGHAGKAFWYGKNTGRFITSDYYYAAEPEWMAAWNELKVADSYRNTQWTLSRDADSYLYEDDRPFEKGYRNLGRTFPKDLGDAPGKDFYKIMPYTPGGDEMTLSFTKALMDAEAVGQGTSTDFLAVSFSSTDKIGHFWGPSSREAEDNLLRLDETLAALFAHVESTVGMASTLVVLCSDHGAPDASEGVNRSGQGVSWVDDRGMLKAANRATKEHFGIEKSLIRSHVAPYIYVDHNKVEELGLDMREVLAVLAKSIEAQTGMAHAVPRWRFEEGQLPSSPMYDRLNRSFNLARSGDLWLVPLPQWQLGSGNPKAVLTSLHGSPWSYDTFVPLIFMGPGIEPRRIHRLVAPRDIAPTLARILGIKAPSAATGRPLPEVLQE